MDLISQLPIKDYLPYFLDRPLWQIWNLFLLGAARLIPVIAISPFLGGKSITDYTKIGLGLFITIIYLPFLIVKSTTPIEMDLHFSLLLIKEVVIGSIMGLILSVPFYYAQAAGSLIDHQRGAQSLQVMDPQTQTQISPIGLLYGNIMLVFFFSIGGPAIFFDALYTSYSLMPVDQFLSPVFFTDANPLWFQIIKIFNEIIKLAVQLSAPPLITILLSDLFLGITNRMAPQVQISFLLWALKALVGLGVLWAAWWLILKQMENSLTSWLKFFSKLIFDAGSSMS